MRVQPKKQLPKKQRPTPCLLNTLQLEELRLLSGESLSEVCDWTFGRIMDCPQNLGRETSR